MTVKEHSVDWNKIVLPHFNKAWYSKNRFLVLMGGAGSGKSYFACEKIMWRAMTQERGRFYCTRKYSTTVRRSVWKMLKDFAKHIGVYDLFSWNQTTMTATFPLTGSEIVCYGLDDREKIKSIPNITGFWHEEPTELAEADLDQCDLRLRGRNHYFQHILTFNPVSELHWLKNKFFDNTDPDSLVDVSTYQHNPHNGPEYHERMEHYRKTNPEYYKVYGLGEWGVLEGLIYQIWPSAGVQHYKDETIYGLDFGFNHPTALVQIDIRDGNYYLTQKIYKEGLTWPALIEQMKAIGIPKNAPIYADAAEPGAIRLIEEAGYNIFKAAKEPNSVSAGIRLLQGLPIFIVEGEDIKAENRSYKWRVKSDGTQLEEPDKNNDHAMDAIRYAIYTHTGGNRFFLGTAKTDVLGRMK